MQIIFKEVIDTFILYLEIQVGWRVEDYSVIHMLSRQIPKINAMCSNLEQLTSGFHCSLIAYYAAASGCCIIIVQYIKWNINVLP